MNISSNTARFLILNLVGFAGIIIAILQGWIADLWLADQTHLVVFIALVFALGIFFVAVKKWTIVRFIADNLVMLGLIGTVIGFKIALSGVDPATASDPSSITPMIAVLISGVYVSLDTTLVGMIGFVWLHLNRFLLSS